MTHPPRDGDEHRPDDGADTGSSSADPDRFPTEPAPTVPPHGSTARYGPPPPYTSSAGYGRNPPYSDSDSTTASYEPSPYAPPAQPYAPPAQPYGAGTPAQPYGQPGQPFGQPGQPFGQPVGGQQPYGVAAYGEQPYGPPPYGPPWGAPGHQFGPPPGPPQKSKVGLIAVLTGVALLVIAAVVVLVIRLQPTVLDAAAAERDVAAQFQQREGVAIDLTCPDNMKVTTGATYDCTGTTADHESVTLRLTITDARTAAYTWTEP